MLTLMMVHKTDDEPTLWYATTRNELAHHLFRLMQERFADDFYRDKRSAEAAARRLMAGWIAMDLSDKDFSDAVVSHLQAHPGYGFAYREVTEAGQWKF